MNQSLQPAIDNVMRAALATGLFVSRATFQALTQQVVGGLPQDVYTNVPGMVNVRCMDAPLAPGTISALEAKALAEIESKGIRHVALDGYYPAVITGWPAGWLCIVDGVQYDILGAEADSQTTQTRVKLQLATVAS